jgi:hypothetical protein
MVSLHLGRVSWWQEHIVEEVLHLIVDRKLRGTERDQDTIPKDKPPMIYFFHLSPIS